MTGLPRYSRGDGFLRVYNATHATRDKLTHVQAAYKHGERRALIITPAAPNYNWKVFHPGQWYTGSISDADRTVKLVVIDVLNDGRMNINPHYGELIVMPERPHPNAATYDWKNQTNGRATRIPVIDAMTAAFDRKNSLIQEDIKKVPRFSGKDGEDRLPDDVDLLLLDKEVLLETLDKLQDPKTKHMFNLFVESMP